MGKLFSNTYRPIRFTEMAGNTLGQKALQKRANEDKFPEVMLFTGLTGTGKTTSALIVAATIQCEDKQTDAKGNVYPCYECDSCKSILNNMYGRDTMFRNCSGMGKQQVLDLQEELMISPMFDLHKIVILDEAQNLVSKAAKSATLTLLEHIPKNVYVILCTMERWSLPKEMIDRCQEFKFKPIEEEDLALYLKEILEKEGLWDTLPDSFFEGDTELNLEPVIQLISKGANGSARSAIQMLERCVEGDLYTSKVVMEELGLFSDSASTKLMLKLLERDIPALSQLNKTEMSSFFHMSYSGLIKAYTLALTKQIDGHTVIPKYIAELVHHPGLKDMLQIFTDIELVGYMKPKVLIAKILLDYYSRIPVVKATRKIIQG